MTPPLFPHQEDELRDHWDDPGRALLWQMRTGKTRAVVETARLLERDRGLRVVLVYAPNGVHQNWVDVEVPRWMGVRPSVTWDTPMVRADPDLWWAMTRTALETPVDGAVWVAVPTHATAFPECRRLVKTALRRGPTLLVVDESDDFGSPSATRTRFLHAVARRCEWRRVLSGTVVENSPLRAYAQYELLGKAALGHKSYGAFKARYAVTETRRVGNRPVDERVVGYRHLDELRRRLAPWSSVVLRADVEGLPPLEPQDVEFSLPDEARRAYKSLAERLYVDLPGGRLELADVSQRFSALHRATSGYLSDGAGGFWDFPGAVDARLAALDHALGRAGGRSVVWVAFREDARRVVAHLRGLGWECLTYHGGTPDAERREVRRAFAPGMRGARVVVGHPAAAGRGLNLSAASAVVWYSHSFDAVLRAQADERATAVGGAAVPVFNLVARDTVDDYALRVLRRKRSLAEDLVRGGLRDLLRRLVGGYDDVK